jgi:hypothetical protein
VGYRDLARNSDWAFKSASGSVTCMGDGVEAAIAW